MNVKKSKADKFRDILDKLGTMILMNLMFLIASLPIVTIGPAFSGLLTAIRYNIRGEKWFAGFRFGYKTRFWRSLLGWSISLLPLLYFLPEINHHWQTEQLVPLIASVFVFAVLAMFNMALMVLNVYVPTPIGVWLSNSANMIRQAFVQILGTAVIFWAPVFVFLMFPQVFLMLALIFLAVYFTLTALAATLFLKDALVDFLVDARAEGVLLAEEGRHCSEEDDAE